MVFEIFIIKCFDTVWIYRFIAWLVSYDNAIRIESVEWVHGNTNMYNKISIMTTEHVLIVYGITEWLVVNK